MRSLPQQIISPSMAVSNGYNTGYTNTLPGTVRSVNYGQLNLGDSSSARYGSVHGEIFDGPQDEGMGVANFVPIVHNLPITHKSTKAHMAVAGELVLLYAMDGSFKSVSTRHRYMHPMAQAVFCGSLTPKELRKNMEDANGDIKMPTAILPLASDFQVRATNGIWTNAHAAFSVQAVSDVQTPSRNREHDHRVCAYAGDNLYVYLKHDDQNCYVALKRTRSTAAEDKNYYLGKAFLNYDSRNDSSAKVIL